MVDELLAALPGEEPVLLLVNGLGATTSLELHAVFETAAGVLAARGHDLAAPLVGTFVPALDMSGFSLTLTRMQPDWLRWWRAPSATPAFPTEVPA
jgi:dihydroxyacetone kinase